MSELKKAMATILYIERRREREREICTFIQIAREEREREGECSRVREYMKVSSTLLMVSKKIKINKNKKRWNFFLNSNYFRRAALRRALKHYMHCYLYSNSYKRPFMIKLGWQVRLFSPRKQTAWTAGHTASKGIHRKVIKNYGASYVCYRYSNKVYAMPCTLGPCSPCMHAKHRYDPHGKHK